MPQRGYETCVSARVTAAQEQFVDSADLAESVEPAQGRFDTRAQRHEDAVAPPHVPPALVGELPTTDIKQARKFRLNAADRAVLEAKTVFFEKNEDLRDFKAAAVPDELIEARS